MGSPRRQEGGGGSFFIENPREGGGKREGPRGREGVCGELGNFWGGGAKYFLRGRNYILARGDFCVFLYKSCRLEVANLHFGGCQFTFWRLKLSWGCFTEKRGPPKKGGTLASSHFRNAPHVHFRSLFNDTKQRSEACLSTLVCKLLPQRCQTPGEERLSSWGIPSRPKLLQKTSLQK